jgi:hypothetical protein
VLALEDDELLPEGHIFEPEVPTRAEKAKKRDQEESNRVYHSGVLSQIACGSQHRRLLKTDADRDVARDNTLII